MKVITGRFNGLCHYQPCSNNAYRCILLAVIKDYREIKWKSAC